MSGTNKASTTGASNLLLEESHRRGGQHLAKEERGQPPGALLNHSTEGDRDVRLVERFRSSDALDLAGGCGFRDVQHIVDRHDANQHAGGIGDRQSGSIVLAKYCDGGLLIVRGLEGDKSAIHEVRDTTVQWRQQEFANANVVNQLAVFVDHVHMSSAFRCPGRAPGRSRAPRRRSTGSRTAT